jgi:cell division initiation protein
MKLTPLLIKKQEFSKSVRGFNPEEVQTFLDKLSSEVDSLLRENEELKMEVEELSEKVIEFQKIEKNLQDTLIKAQESSSKTLESTKKQTSLMIKEAEIKASQLIENARENANEIRNAVSTLKEEKDLIIARLRAIVNSQANLLEGKVKEAGEEPSESKKQGSSEKVDLDVDDIVDKLL